MHVSCNVAADHVAILGAFELTLWSAKSFAEFTLECVKNCPKSLSFGSFAGAGALHQGLRRLKGALYLDVDEIRSDLMKKLKRENKAYTKHSDSPLQHGCVSG